MNLLDLAMEYGLQPKRTASTNGGEYHSPCPACGGKDRFILWPQKDGYLCRQCDKKGDSIQFCRDFMNMGYRESCAKIGIEPKSTSTFFSRALNKPKFSPERAGLPSIIWREKARAFALECHQNLLSDQGALKLLYNRGFSLRAVEAFKLGWNRTNRFLALREWDLPIKFKEDGKECKLWLPGGIVIPSKLQEDIIKLKIRRHDWSEDEDLPKYVEVSGSMKCPAVYGDITTRVAVIVEAELDAMLIQQYASDLCCCVAIGGAGKRPDLDSDYLLRNMSIILFALDFDEAGRKAFQFWRSTYQLLRPWPVPSGKSPGDALKLGVDLRKWISIGLQRFKSL